MNKLVALSNYAFTAIVLFLCFFFVSNSVFAATLAEIKERGVMNVITEDDYAPFEMIKDGKATGFDHDIIQQLKKYAPFNVSSEIMPWTGLLPSVLSGKYDIAITGAVITPQRLNSFDFTPPFASARHYAIINADNKQIKTVADLNGKTLGVQAGSALLTGLPKLKAMLAKTGGKLGKVVQYTSYPEAYLDLANHRLDYVINTYVPAKLLTQQHSHFFKLSVPVSGQGYHAWAIPKGNKQLLEFMTKFMQHLRSTGELARLQEKWFGVTMLDLPQVPITSATQYNELVKAPMPSIAKAASGNLKKQVNNAESQMNSADWGMLLSGAWTTIWLSLISIGIGLVVGLGIALIRTLRLPVIDPLLSTFISLTRATPLITLALFIFLGLPAFGIEINRNLIAILALSINTSAFNAEIWRSAFIAFPREQREAAEAAGMNRWLSFRRIMLPQMFFTSLPALVNEMTFLIKASPAVAVIGVVDLTRVTNRIAAVTYQPLPPILVACAVYMLLIGLMLRCQRWSENLSKHYAG